MERTFVSSLHVWEEEGRVFLAPSFLFLWISVSDPGSLEEVPGTALTEHLCARYL